MADVPVQARFRGAVALVTGGGGGIGGAVARGLAREGAFVAVADFDGGRAERVVAEIRADHGAASAIVADVSTVSGVRDLFDAVDACQPAPLSILVSTAGRIQYCSIVDQDELGFDQTIAVNLRGSYFCLQQAARRMTSTGGGTIVNMASTAAFVAPRLPAVVYSMTKAAIRQLTAAAAVELAPAGIRVNAIAPATTRTEFVQGTLASQAQTDRAIARIPLGRIAEPADMVGPILFLASAESAYMTGHTLVVDGGLLCSA